MIELNQILLADCMDVMKDITDKYFELAIVDPPYGINSGGGKMGGDKLARCKIYHKYDDSKPPDKNYFDNIFRISKNQIIWGANHFISKIPYDSSCWIVWYKENGENNFADIELAWASFKTAARMIRFKWAGMLQENMKEKEERIHPNQKPVALYRWLLQNYAKPGDKIIDTHSGSGSCAIACFLEHHDFLAIEKDADYHAASVKRFEEIKAQGRLF